MQTETDSMNNWNNINNWKPTHINRNVNEYKMKPRVYGDNV